MPQRKQRNRSTHRTGLSPCVFVEPSFFFFFFLAFFFFVLFVVLPSDRAYSTASCVAAGVVKLL